MKKLTLADMLFAVIITGIMLLLLVYPIYLLAGYKWAASVWCVLMFINIVNMNKKIANKEL